MSAPVVFEGVTFRHSSEALKPQPPIDWLVEGLLARKSVAVFAGEPGSKKTYAALDLAVCLACGVDWLNFPTRQGGVLFVDEESGAARFDRRLGDVIRGHLLQESDVPVWSTCLAGFNFFTEPERWAGVLRAAIQGLDVGLVVIDSLVDVMLGGDENAVSDTALVLYELRAVADALNVAIVVIHHSNKAGGYRGSSAIKGGVDLMLMVESKPGEVNLTFKTEKARDIEPVTFAATAHFEPDQFWLSPATVVEAAPILSKPKQFVVDYLSAHGDTLLPTLKAGGQVLGFKDYVVRDAVLDLTRMGLIARKNEGAPLGVAAVYGLV